MSAKRAILSTLPGWLVSTLRRGRHVAKNLPHALATSVTREPVAELLGVLRGRPTVPVGSVAFFENFFRIAERKAGPCHFIDVGASDGWFVNIAHRFLSEAPRITCFEPLRSKRRELEELSRAHPNVSFRGVAVGEKRKSIEINEIAATGLSSLREIDRNCVSYSEAYNTTVADRYTVDVVTLDAELDGLIGPGGSVVLKIDTQGYELEVLQGASRWLASGRIKLILIELMTIRKYKGASLYDEILNHLHVCGFSLFDMYPGFHEPNGYLTEFDVVLVHHSVRFDELFINSPVSAPPTPVATLP